MSPSQATFVPCLTAFKKQCKIIQLSISGFHLLIYRYGEVSEPVDEHDLGSCAFGRRSSNLLFPIKGGPMPKRFQVSDLIYVVASREDKKEGKEC